MGSAERAEGRIGVSPEHYRFHPGQPHRMINWSRLSSERRAWPTGSGQGCTEAGRKGRAGLRVAGRQAPVHGASDCLQTWLAPKTVPITVDKKGVKSSMPSATLATQSMALNLSANITPALVRKAGLVMRRTRTYVSVQPLRPVCLVSSGTKPVSRHAGKNLSLAAQQGYFALP